MTYKDYLFKAQSEISALNPNGYYETYKKYEFGYWQHIPEWIYEYCQENNVKQTIDCGMAYGSLGLYVKLISGCDLFGIDFIKYISDELINKYNIKYQIKNMELESLDEFNGKFDLILFTEVLEHMRYSPLSILRKIRNLLISNGVIMLSTPDSSSGWGKITKFYKSWRDMPEPDRNIVLPDQHIYQFDIFELKEIFNIVGLKIDKLDYSKSGKDLRHFNMLLSKV
jgi:SAM-dependent methyltransferase